MALSSYFLGFEIKVGGGTVNVNGYYQWIDSAVLLPPVHRPYRNFCAIKSSSPQSISSTKNQTSDVSQAYHVGCFSEEA